MASGGLRPLAAIVGPTASGKTELAVAVAEHLIARGQSVEIVSCDSMGVYIGLDIAADKPTAQARRGVPHHLFDVVACDQEFTVVRYRELARRAIADIHSRGALPLLVGGSGLYFRAVVDDLTFAPTDPQVRARLEADDPDELHARLRAIDPERAAVIEPSNVRRVVRALEIHELTGQRPSELRGEWDRFESRYALRVVGVRWTRDELYRRAADRVRRELEAGLVDEVRRASQRGISRTAWQALGIKEVLDHLDEPGPEMERQLVRNTKAFIRRQLQWFERDPRVRWVDLDDLEPGDAPGRLVAEFGF